MIRLVAVAGALIISFSAIFFVLSGVDAVTGTFYRAAYSLPVLVILWLLRRGEDTRSRLSRLLAFGAGLILTVDLIAWQTAIGYIGAGLATLLANLQVIVVALVAWWLLGERPSRAVGIAIPVVLMGVALVSGIGQGNPFGDDPALGTLFGLIAAVFYGAFLLLFRHSNRAQAPPAGPLMDAMVAQVLMTLLVGLIGPPIEFGFQWPSHGWLIALALGGFLSGWMLVSYALPRLPAAETATIILIQPALTMLWSGVLLGETPSPLQILGAVVVLTGVAFVAISETKTERTAKPEPILDTP